MDLPNHKEGTLERTASRPVFTLGIASQLAEIPAHSIRQYVDMGLIIPFKLESKRHLFSMDDIQRLKRIQILIQERGLNFAGIRAMMAMVPCWAVKKCSEKDKQSCGAFKDSFQPCWEASDKGRPCRNVNCRECEVYHSLVLDTGIKSLVRAL
jgi:MerR family transcriptional regulator/heat shock protein HspR